MIIEIEIKGLDDVSKEYLKSCVNKEDELTNITTNDFEISSSEGVSFKLRGVEQCT